MSPHIFQEACPLTRLRPRREGALPSAPTAIATATVISLLSVPTTIRSLLSAAGTKAALHRVHHSIACEGLVERENKTCIESRVRGLRHDWHRRCCALRHSVLRRFVGVTDQRVSSLLLFFLASLSLVEAEACPPSGIHLESRRRHVPPLA